jgi:transcriptional regulator with XRE-family HTH domain
MGYESRNWAFGELLKKWRTMRRYSQLQLALDLGVSSRHLSFIETGRSNPSREMVLLLAEHLDLPLRERNAMLLSAGFAPAFEQRSIEAPELSAVRDAVKMVLKGHEPFPAIAVDRSWNVIMSNCGAAFLGEGVAPELLSPTPNVYRLSLHPNGFRPRVLNFQEYAGHLVARLRRDSAVHGGPELHALLTEIETYPGISELSAPVTGRGGVALPLCVESDGCELAFITTIATFGTPYEVTVSELAIETFFPADNFTANYVRSRAHKI